MDNLRRLLIIFCVVFFLTVAVGGFVLSSIIGGGDTTLVKDIPVNAPTYNPDQSGEKESAFKQNFLLILSDENDDKSVITSIINVDTDSKKISLLFIPFNIKYGNTSSQYVTTIGKLPKTFTSDGAKQTASTISAFLDMDIQYYIDFPVTEFCNFVSEFCKEDGGVSFDIPTYIEYTNCDGDEVTIAPGSKQLQGIELADLIRFYRTDDDSYSAELLEYYNGSDICRIRVFQSYIDQFLKQKFIDSTVASYKNDFETVLISYLLKNEIKSSTNISGEVAGELAKVIKSISDYTINYYVMTGTESYNAGELYLNYSGYLLDLKLEDAVATVSASDILPSKFKVENNSKV